MPRPLLLVPAVAIAALLAVLPAATAPAAGPEKGTVVQVEFELQASNGFHAYLETNEDGTVTLRLRNQSSQVSYRVEAEVTETGLKAEFGSLGLIDVAFTPTGTLNSTEPSEGCTGAPRTLREGIFSGTIDFTGEREYVRIEGSQAEGSMSVISQWQCPADELPPFAGVSRLSAPRPRGKITAQLGAAGPGCSCIFAAESHVGKKGRRSLFYGGKDERREGMRIVRLTYARAGAGAFVFDSVAGTATLRPPPPFSGHATLRQRPRKHSLWRSTIQVPLPGADPLRTSGFRAEVVFQG